MLFDRFFARIIGLSTVLLLILGALSLLIHFAPAVATGLFWLLAIVACIAAIFFTVASIAIAAKIRPLQPVAEISILGKHSVGLSKLLVALLAFFGNTALTWIIAASVTFQQTPDLEFSSITNQLWSLFLALAGSIEYLES